MNTTERLADWLRDNCDTAELVIKWNSLAPDNNYTEDYIYYNDDSFFNHNFRDIWEAVCATAQGNWCASDDYVCINGYGHPMSFSHWDALGSPIDIEMLAEWMIEADDIPDELAEELEEEED